MGRKDRQLRRACESSRFVQFRKTHREDVPCGDLAPMGLFNQRERLFLRDARRNDHASTRPQLLQKRRRDQFTGSGDHDLVERCVLGPAVITVADAHRHGRVSQMLEAPLRALREFLDQLDGEHPPRQFRKDGRLVAATWQEAFEAAYWNAVISKRDQRMAKPQDLK